MPNRVLEIYRDGRRYKPFFSEPLESGTSGNLQALKYMAQIVREDSKQPDLRNYILREIVGATKGFDFPGEISKCFEFAQKRIVYRQDPVNVERVADLWSTMYAFNPLQPEGDCGIKTTCLATCLASLGHKPRFVVIQQNPLSTNFNHVYVEVQADRTWKPLDPTPENTPESYEPKSILKATYPIF